MVSPWEHGDSLHQLTDKFNEVVAAILVLQNSVNTINGVIGNLGDLVTADKSSLVRAINEIRAVVDDLGDT